MSIVSLIAAMAKNRVIGKNNVLPWSLPDDHENFRKITAGKAFIMGKLSYLSEDKLLSSHRNIILSTQQNFDLCNTCERARSLQEALQITQAEPETFILGGGSVFEDAIAFADKMYLTLVDEAIEGDTFFPEVDWSEWKEVSSRFHPADANHSHAFYLNEYVRKKT